MNKRKLFANTAQSAVIVLLVFLLLAFSFLYIYTENYASRAAYPDFPEEHMHLLSKDASLTMKSSKSGFIYPSFVLITDPEGVNYGGFPQKVQSEMASSAVKNPVWAEFERVLPLLSDCKLEKKSFSDSSLAFEYADGIFAGSNKLYCEFAKPLPLAAIAVFFENTYNDSILYKESFFAKFMILTSAGEADGNGGVCLYIVDEKGNVITAVPQTALMFNSSLLSDPEALGLAKVQPTIVDAARKNGLLGYVPVFERTIVRSPIYKEAFSDYFGIQTDSAIVSGILSAFGMNPNNTNRFTDADGTVGFVETSGQLEVTLDGVISFEADADDGISLSKLIGYVPEGVKENGYSFEEKVAAACAVLEALDTKMLGGDAEPVLENAAYESESGLTWFGFSYHMDGIDIENGREYDAVLAFGDTSLVKATVYAEIYSDTGDKYTDIPQKAALAAAVEKWNKQWESGDKRQVICGVSSRYVCSNSDKDTVSENAVFVPAWVAEYAEASENHELVTEENNSYDDNTVQSGASVNNTPESELPPDNVTDNNKDNTGNEQNESAQPPVISNEDTKGAVE